MHKHLTILSSLAILGLAACKGPATVNNSEAVGHSTETAVYVPETVVDVNQAAYQEPNNLWVLPSNLLGEAGDMLTVDFNFQNWHARVGYEGEVNILQGHTEGLTVVYADQHWTFKLGLEDAELWQDGKRIFVHRGQPNVNAATNARGERLDMHFGSIDNRALLVWKGDSILVRQDLGQASGIRYVNEAYEFTGWKGITQLKKNGRLIFEDRGNEGPGN
jgi:hypothetical protein